MPEEVQKKEEEIEAETEVVEAVEAAPEIPPPAEVVPSQDPSFISARARLGGKARAAKRSPEELSAHGKKMAVAKWRKYRKTNRKSLLRHSPEAQAVAEKQLLKEMAEEEAEANRLLAAPPPPLPKPEIPFRPLFLPRRLPS